LSDSSAPEPQPSPHEIHKVIREEGEEQLKRHGGAIAWSGLAAGLSMGFSFLTMALVQGRLPNAEWTPLVTSLGYTIGFLIVILGRQQLFTETTLTPVLPILTHYTVARLGKLFRFWGIVLSTNLVGTWLFAWAISHESFFVPTVWHSLGSIAIEAVQEPFWPMVFKAVLAGWLIALMVWVLPGAGPAKLPIIVIITYTVAMGHFSHSIAGSCEAAFAVITGTKGLYDYFFVFLFPTVLGNTIGGVTLVAVLNHAPLATEA
jgi:formate/nitrite transporter FocA (FNT family)